MSDTRPRSVSHHAADNLAFIRAAMERSSTFTAVAGAGGIIVGGIGVGAAMVGAMQPTAERWLWTWLCAATLAVPVELVAMARKARRVGLTSSNATAQRFALGIAAPLVAGAAITYALWTTRDFAVMAPTWLVSYGVAVITGGMFSVPVVRATGVGFILVGVAAVLTPVAWRDVWLGGRFGELHLLCGFYIARYHGG